MIKAIKQKLNWLKRKVKKVLVVLGVVGTAMAASGSLTTTSLDITIDKLPQKYNSSDIKQEYQLIDGAKLKKVIKDNWEDRVIVEVGKKKQVFQQEVFGGKSLEIFTPSLKMARWDEVDFELDPEPIIGSIPLKDRKLDFVGKKIKYTTPKKELHFYNIEPNEKLREGGYEFEVILKEKPSTNKLEFTINTKGLEFYYQPPMTKEKLEEGQTADETHIYDKDGNVVAERPENVVGSYAVYHESKSGDYSKMKGKNYRAGKAFHIYRPKITDANGNWTWGKLNIDEKKGILTIEIDQNFLDKAVYPVKIDPTFGYDTVGSSEGSLTEDYIVGTLATLSESGSGDSISMYCDLDGWEIKYALYLESDNSLKGTTLEDNGPVDKEWFTLQFSSSPSLSAADYRISCWSPYIIQYNYDSCTDCGAYKSQTYNGWPDPISWDATDFDRRFSIYCTYTAGGGASVTTNAVSSIKDTEATGNGNVTAINDTSITERGFVWDTSSKSKPEDVAPTSSGYANYTNETGSFSTGTFNLTLSSLTEGTTYYVRAYAKNNDGHYGYGDEVTFIAGEIKRIDTTNDDFDAGTHNDTTANNNNLELAASGYSEGFEGSFPPSGWSTGGDANWFKSTNQVHGGSYSAEGGDITHNQSTYLEWTAPDSGTLSFWWKVSSENNYDWLRFKINGTEQFKISGSVDWEQKTGISVSSGDTLRWEYTKDSSVSGGSDTGWVDDILLDTGGYKTSGTYESATMDISKLYSADDSEISWNATLNGQSLTVKTRYSTDGGSSWSSWATATNGGAMSGVGSIGTNTSNALVQYRVEMSGDGSNTPQLHDITMRVMYGAGGGATTTEMKVIIIE